MKISKSISLMFLALFLFGFYANAQEFSKEDKKNWKKQAKEYKNNPEALKAMTERVQILETDLSKITTEARQLRQTVNSLEIEKSQKDSRIAGLENQVRDLTEQLTAARTELLQRESRPAREVVTERGSTVIAIPDMSGIVFRVQLGAFKKRQVNGALTTDPNLLVEDENGLQRVTIGHFREFEKAKELRDHIVAMGVKGAWVVPYKNGERISLKEAMKG